MSTPEEVVAACEACGIRLAVDGDGGLSIDAPRGALTPERVDVLRRHKADLLALLEPVVTDHDRQQAHREAITEANSRYAGGPLDWAAVDAAAERIFSAGCRRELNAAVADYVRAVSPPEPVDELSDIASRLFPLDGSPPERSPFDELRDAQFPSA